MARKSWARRIGRRLLAASAAAMLAGCGGSGSDGAGGASVQGLMRRGT